MRIYPEDKSDFEDANRVGVKDWQLELLKLNPEYPYWGNYEDYMSNQKDGWDSRQEIDSFADIWKLDDYNECVNFYFFAHRDSEECTSCKGRGLNPYSAELAEAWYAHDRPADYIECPGGKSRWNNNGWSNHITDVEVEALVKAGRLRDLMSLSVMYCDEDDCWKHHKGGEWVKCPRPEMPTAQAVNEWNRCGRGFGHDGINQFICVEARAGDKYGECETCEGRGAVFTEDKCHLRLQLWMLHPRKGASRGLVVKDIQESDLEVVFTWLKEARDRNNDRFSKIK